MTHHDISPRHAIFGENWRKLDDGDILQPGDQTACISTMLAPEGDAWVDVPPDWNVYGKTVQWYCGESDDCDRCDRLFWRYR